jgi:hypothetical protein
MEEKQDDQTAELLSVFSVVEKMMLESRGLSGPRSDKKFHSPIRAAHGQECRQRNSYGRVSPTPAPRA